MRLILLMLLTLVGLAGAQEGPECGDGESCVQEGLRYAQGRGELAELRLALTALDASCHQGTARACAHSQLLRLAWPELGAAPMTPGAEAYAAAAKELEAQCQGSAGCTTMGLALEVGVPGVAANPGRALELHTQACAGGVARSCARASKIHSEGPSAYRDPAQSAQLARQACNGGDASACLGVAESTLSAGTDGAADRAAPLLLKACEGEVWSACTRLARLHLDEAVSAPDPAQAAVWLAKACEAGEEEACAPKP